MSSLIPDCFINLAKKTVVLGLMLFCTSSAIALTGGRLVGMINGSEEEKSAAVSYVVGAVDSMDQLYFCRPYKFQPEKIFGALEIQLTYNPFFQEASADMLIREVLIKLTPCNKKSTTRCICLNR